MNSDRRSKTVKGCYFDNDWKFPVPKKCDVTVRMTADDRGQTLSLQAYNIMIVIPLEAVSDIITLTERKKL